MICTYCGEDANTIDHVPPTMLWSTVIGDYPHVEVPACLSCNSALGARRLMTVEARKAWISAWLPKHYAKYLSIPNWVRTRSRSWVGVCGLR